MATKQKTGSKAAEKTPAKAKAAPKTETKFDGQKGYGGTGSDYRPPDTDPVKQTLRTGDDAERMVDEGGPAKDEE